MNLKSIIKKVDNKEVLTCILLIIVGYMTAQLFMRRVNGFNVGGQNSCYFKDVTCKLGQSEYPIPSGKSDPCKGISQDKCNKSWYENTIKGGANKTTPIGIACLWNSSGKDCVTPGTGFKSSSGCPTKSCDAPTPGPPGGKTPTPGPTTYSCNASTNKCEPDSNGSYTNASNCQSNCDVSAWDWPANTFTWYSWPILIIYFIVGIIFILLMLYML